MSIIFNPIGIIHTPIKVKEDAPIQSAIPEINGEVEVFPEFIERLDGIEEFSHIYLLYHLNLTDISARSLSYSRKCSARCVSVH